MRFTTKEIATPGRNPVEDTEVSASETLVSEEALPPM